MWVDLHIHSCLSPCADDDMTPANICGMAHIKGLDAIAVTDHNTARNLPFVKEAADYYNDLYNNMQIRYGDMKKQMAVDANKLLTPIREKILAYSSDDALLDRIMRQGAEAAAARAEKTIEEVREIIGFRKV